MKVIKIKSNQIFNELKNNIVNELSLNNEIKNLFDYTCNTELILKCNNILELNNTIIDILYNNLYNFNSINDIYLVLKFIKDLDLLNIMSVYEIEEVINCTLIFNIDLDKIYYDNFISLINDSDNLNFKLFELKDLKEYYKTYNFLNNDFRFNQLNFTISQIKKMIDKVREYHEEI